MANKVPPPDTSKAVYTVMLQYVLDKDYRFTNQQIDLMAETMFNHFDAIGWKSGRAPITYWPSVAKRWVNGEVAKDYKKTSLFGSNQPRPSPVEAGPSSRSKDRGDTLRDRIRKQMENR